jgi:hypothetical protein
MPHRENKGRARLKIFQRGAFSGGGCYEPGDPANLDIKWNVSDRW